MPIVHVQNQYVIPRGRVYIDPYDANEQLTGEIPLGNCPEVTIEISQDKWEHFSSEQGLEEKDAGGAIRVNRTGSITCDNFSPRNAALWLSGAHTVVTQGTTPVTGEERTVLPGRIYQLGSTAGNPLGVRNVTAITVKNEDGTVTYDVGDDYNVDPENGRVQIVEGGAITAGVVQFGYTPVGGTFDAVQSGATAELMGALRVVPDNATGPNDDVYLPKVSLSSSGNLSLIASGTEPITMEFGMEVLKPANAQAIYRAGRPVA
ncbi:hypothetical protein [Acidovorax sp. Leaf73]|uniref:phage tail tube protein n=1 Tax=Acidovorax sp. Leaf73 TaxID=2876566 RepID=UPI001E481C42|nr:hypothetical protein [Acidovorax sp. Leaf73]